MNRKIFIPLLLWTVSIFNVSTILCAYANTSTQHHHVTPMRQAMQINMTPRQALERLKAGNRRFINNKPLHRDLLKEAKTTRYRQHPAAIILSCIDSRVPPEIVFDQGIGDLFVTRIAGNVINNSVLASMEFATKVSGAKLIVVLGHQSCGAIKGACEGVKLGHLTELLAKIQPAVKLASKQMHTHNCNNYAYINQITKDNILYVMREIPQHSKIIRQLIRSGRVGIVGAMYHLRTGKVTFITLPGLLPGKLPSQHAKKTLKVNASAGSS